MYGMEKIQLNFQINATHITKINHQLHLHRKGTQPPLCKCRLISLGLGNKEMFLG